MIRYGFAAVWLSDRSGMVDHPAPIVRRSLHREVKEVDRTSVSKFGLRFVAAGSVAFLVGCGSQNTESVSSNRSQPPSSETRPAASTQAPSTPSSGSAHGLAWDVPSGFTQDTPSGTMRVAQYKIPASQEGTRGGELALFYFGAGVGGDTQSNLQRWANQFKQADGGDPMAKAKVETFKAKSGLSVTTIHLTGRYQTSGMGSGPNYDMPGWAWFFKAVGPEAVLTAQHEQLLHLYQSVRLGS
jgi:hypothetical protein